MRISSKAGRCATFLMLASLGVSALWSQNAVLHIQQTQTTSQGSQKGFPTFLAMYPVLNSAKSSLDALSLTGTLSLKNDEPTFSEVLYLLMYWQGSCPAHDINLQQGPTTVWIEIIKNSSLGVNRIPINLNFPGPIPMTGCIGLYYGGGPVIQGKATMTANLNLEYRSAEANANKNFVINPGGGEYCFGQHAGCENATEINEEGFASAVTVPAGHLLGLYGNISDSSFDGTSNFGPIPTGKSWGALNEFYLLPGGCGIFEENLNDQGFSNPAPLSTLHEWLPQDAMLIASVPMVDRISPGGTGRVSLQSQVQNVFSTPIKVNEGDCLVNIFGEKGNGATDNETQVLGLMGP